MCSLNIITGGDSTLQTIAEWVSSDNQSRAIPLGSEVEVVPERLFIHRTKSCCETLKEGQ